MHQPKLPKGHLQMVSFGSNFFFAQGSTKRTLSFFVGPKCGLQQQNAGWDFFFPPPKSSGQIVVPINS